MKTAPHCPPGQNNVTNKPGGWDLCVFFFLSVCFTFFNLDFRVTPPVWISENGRGLSGFFLCSPAPSFKCVGGLGAAVRVGCCWLESLQMLDALVYTGTEAGGALVCVSYVGEETLRQGVTRVRVIMWSL